MESKRKEMKRTTDDLVLDALMIRPMTHKELQDATGRSRAAVEKAVKVLRENGDVYSVSLEGAGVRGRPLVTHHYNEDGPEGDFTPNAEYKGPSYTYFLQGIWR